MGKEGARSYLNLEIEFIKGRTATLTVMEDGIEVEKVVMSDFKTEEEMHDALASRGFQKLSGDELIHMLRMKNVEEKRIWRRRTQYRLDRLKFKMEAKAKS